MQHDDGGTAHNGQGDPAIKNLTTARTSFEWSSFRNDISSLYSADHSSIAQDFSNRTTMHVMLSLLPRAKASPMSFHDAAAASDMPYNMATAS